MQWKKFEDELPPIGKKLVVTGVNGDEKLHIITFGYSFSHEQHYGFPNVSTEKDIKNSGGFWFELPDLTR